MKKVKFIVRVLLIVIFIIILFREFLFNKMINYAELNEREVISISNKKLIQEIRQEKNSRDLSIKEILSISDKITNRSLSFSSGQVSRNPNQAFLTGKANCTGYAALFGSVAAFLIEEQQDQHKYKVKQLVGQLDFMGMNLHQFSENPFFQDHDYNEIEYLETGAKIYVDPSVSDYFWIDRISARE